MRLLFLGQYDAANVSNRVARAFNSVAGETVARVLTEQRHPFQYPEDLIGDKGIPLEVYDAVNGVDWLIATEDGGNYSYFRMVRKMLQLPTSVRIATRRIGTLYRTHTKTCDALDAAMKFDRRFVGSDLYRFALTDPLAVPMFAPPYEISPTITPVGDRIRIGHSPSRRHAKNTDGIMRVLDKLRSDAEIDLIENVSFTECHERRKACHVFVDQMTDHIGGFGASSVEAMAVGCAVLADVHHVLPEVERFYARPPIANVQNETELENALRLLINDRDLLADHRERCRQWINTYATPRATAAYWTRHLQ